MYIIENEERFKEANEKKADILVSSAILGFALTRHYQNQPCQLDHEHPNENDYKAWGDLLEQKDKVSSIEGTLSLLKTISLAFYRHEKKTTQDINIDELDETDELTKAFKKSKKEKEEKTLEEINGEIGKLKDKNKIIKKIEQKIKNKTEQEQREGKEKEKIEDDINYGFIKKTLEEIKKEAKEKLEEAKPEAEAEKEAEIFTNEEIQSLKRNKFNEQLFIKYLSENEYKELDENSNHTTEETLKEILTYCEYIKEIDDQHNHLNILSTISHVMDCYEPGSGKILDGQSPLGKEGKLITGKKGGEGLAFKERHGRMRISKAQMLEDAFNKKYGIYRGRGAYTGMVDNPLKDNEEVYPTERVAYEVKKGHYFIKEAGKLLKRTLLNLKDIDGEDADKKNIPWGMISPSNDKFINVSIKKNKGMGPIICDRKEIRVGYVHGMCTAIVKCKHLGPWATPYEMATGSATTKMASCFACTTYMYANGYPPSSIHLGRGESWVPPNKEYTRLEGKEDTKSKDLDYSDNCLKEWQREIGNYVSLGLDCIKKAKAMNLIDSKHKELVKEIEEEIKKKTGNTKWTPMDEVKNTEDQKVVSEFFLEALTVHKKDSDRIKEVFNPLYQKYLTLSKHSFT